MVESIFTMFHLRRVQFQEYVKEAKSRSLQPEHINDGIEPSANPAVRERSTMILLDKQTKIGRNPELVDVVLHSVIHSNMISRDHSEIIGETDNKGNLRYYISDRSLNGTYVNDTRVKEKVLLNEGDLIKFGHVNGAAIKPGEHAPQQSAEFIFRFEHALPKFAYFGYSQKGVRVHPHHQNEHAHNQQQQQRRAYMQINSDRILPTEVYGSLAPSGGASAAAVGGANGPTVPRPIAPGGSCLGAVTSSASVVATTTACLSSAGAPPACAAPSFPFLPSSSNGVTTSASATVIPRCLATTSVHNSIQIAQLNAMAAATTLANTAAASAASNNAAQQQQQRHQSIGGTADATTNSATAASALNALNQLGLTSATEEQVAAVNAHLRQLMASHDAMSAMERLAAQQQWNNSLLKLSSLQQQNPLVYGHAFPAAAAAAAALFTGCIDMNSGGQNAAAAQYAASLWPNIRALQPSVSQSADWTQQQKAAALAQQLQLRLPGLYQQQQQQAVAACVVQSRGTSVSMPSVAPSLFGTPSAFSLPGAHNHLHNTNSSASLPSSSSAGLLIAAQQQCVSTSSSSSSAAYASCTSSASSAVGVPPIRPLGESPISSLSRGTSSVSLPLHQSQGTSIVDQHQQQNPAAALAVRLAAAQQLAKELEADQQAKSSNNTVPGWTMGISCSSAAGTSVPVTKVSPVTGPSNGSSDGGGGTTPLQRIPGIASALAAAVVAAQQQHHNNNNVPPWPSGTPPNNAIHPSLDTPPIRQPLAQRIFSPAVSNSSSLSMSSGSSKSSSGVSSATSNALLQSPGSNGTTMMAGLNNSDVGKEFRDSFASLLTTNSLTTSAFSSPQITNNTNLNTLTTAMFAAEREKAANAVGRQRTKSMSANPSEEMDFKVAEVKQRAEGEAQKERETTQKLLQNQALIDQQKVSLNGSPLSFSSDQNQHKTDEMEASETAAFHAESLNDSRKFDGMAQCEEKREQMECDSSVPSPPPVKEQKEKLTNATEKVENGEDFRKEQRESAHLSAEPSSRRKRHSSTGSPISVQSFDEGIEAKTDRNKGGNQKPRPIKQTRKSNEVARLLNDLTAGNCSWQYMAERSQKLASQGSKPTVRGDGTDSPSTKKDGRTGVEKGQKNLQPQFAKIERKRPLRLEERKKAEMERKRAHKMMRQISDESSDEEHNGGGTGSTNGRRGESMANSTTKSRNDGQPQQRHGDTSKKEVASPQLSSSDEGDGDDDNCRKSHDLESSDSDNNHHQRHHRHTNNIRRKDSDTEEKMGEKSTTKAMANGGGTVPKRKLLSSAPGTKKAMTMMNNVATTTSKLANGAQRNSEGQQKRGPKGGRTENKDKAVHSSKKLTANTPSAVTTPTSIKTKMLGRNIGNGRGRPLGSAHKAVDGSSNSGDSSDDDSFIDQHIQLASESRDGGEDVAKAEGETSLHQTWPRQQWPKIGLVAMETRNYVHTKNAKDRCICPSIGFNAMTATSGSIPRVFLAQTQPPRTMPISTADVSGRQRKTQQKRHTEKAYHCLP
ncbi:hypothetical protein niasHT_007280 [Heterodera trifolii]|uniref:FHA domain-containing protein n=1 Tax=Heterodera trifolii TaxID=157864 RepID=A0ABD2LL70_9BILA